jgi:hypothetical protein
MLGHDFLDVCKKLEQLDGTSRKCNVCKKFLIVTSPTAKTFSSHSCQRTLRKNLNIAIERLKSAKKAAESAKSQMAKVAAARRLRKAQETLEHLQAANFGSEDAEDLRVAATIKELPVVPEQSVEQSGEGEESEEGGESEDGEEGEGRNRPSMTIPPNHVETQPQPPPKRKRTEVVEERSKYKYLSIGKYEIYYI